MLSREGESVYDLINQSINQSSRLNSDLNNVLHLYIKMVQRAIVSGLQKDEVTESPLLYLFLHHVGISRKTKKKESNDMTELGIEPRNLPIRSRTPCHWATRPITIPFMSYSKI